MKKVIMTICLVMLFVGSTTANAALYSEDFEGGSLNGWGAPGHTVDVKSDATAYGSNTTKFFYSYRWTKYPYAHGPIDGDAAAGLLGNWQTKYGTGLLTLSADIARDPDFTWYVSIEGDNGNASFRRNNGFSGYYSTGSSANWQWEHISMPIDPDWTNEEAHDNGWYSDTGTWSTMMQDVEALRFGRGGRYGGNTNNEEGSQTGLDNVSLVPEPATIGLLLLGFGFLRRRR